MHAAEGFNPYPGQIVDRTISISKTIKLRNKIMLAESALAAFLVIDGVVTGGVGTILIGALIAAIGPAREFDKRSKLSKKPNGMQEYVRALRRNGQWVSQELKPRKMTDEPAKVEYVD